MEHTVYIHTYRYIVSRAIRVCTYNAYVVHIKLMLCVCVCACVRERAMIINE